MELENVPLARSSIQCCSCGCSSCNGCSSPATWARTVKRKYDELEGTNSFSVPGSELDYPPVAKIHVENEIDVLREMVSDQQEAIQDLCLELEEERNASSSAANETMSMILRLQKEKAEIQMEARQFKWFAEEKMSHDHEELEVLEDLLYKREQVIQSLTCEVQAYKHRIMSYGLTDAEIDGEKSLVLAGNQSMVEILDDEFESPEYGCPPMICYTNETLLEVESEVTDVEKNAFDVPLRDVLEKKPAVSRTFSFISIFKAINVLKEVVRLAPNLPDSYHTLGLIYTGLENDKKAKDLYMIAARLAPKDSALWKLLYTWSFVPASSATLHVLHGISRI